MRNRVIVDVAHCASVKEEEEEDSSSSTQLEQVEFEHVELGLEDS